MSASSEPSKSVVTKGDQVRSQVQKGELEPEKAVWLARKHLSWTEWLYIDFLRYWYLLGVLALEVFAGLELVRDLHVRTVPGALLVVAVMIGIAYAAFTVYKYLWPEGILTDLANRPGPRKVRRRRFD